jgi:diacylglycerol kinase family enzyme
MAGVGFDAMVIEETKWESKKMLGPLAYLLSAVKVLGGKPPQIEVLTVEGHRETGVAVLCGNGSLYGGQFRLFRNADNLDSKLDVIVFKEAGYRFVLDSLHGIALGGIDLAASTSYFQSEGFTVTCPREVPVEIDGELLGRFKDIEFRETSTRLRVLAPETPCATPFTDAMKSLLQWPPKPQPATVAKIS